jgi:hypothetical protein
METLLSNFRDFARNDKSYYIIIFLSRVWN